MTESEARSKIKYRLGIARQIAGNGVDGKSFEEFEIALQALKEIRQYRELGTVEELKTLKEKNEPKSPLRIPTDDTCLYYELRCPSCNAYMSGLIEIHHCTCGQRLSWE